MKKNHYFWSLLTLVMVGLMSVGLASCGSDDNGGGGGGAPAVSADVASLQGTWEFFSGKETVMGYTITMSRKDLTEMKKSMEKSMGQRINIWDETLTFEGYKLNGANYTLKDKQIILEGVDPLAGLTITVGSVSETALVLHEEFKADGVELVADIEYHKKQ